MPYLFLFLLIFLVYNFRLIESVNSKLLGDSDMYYSLWVINAACSEKSHQIGGVKTSDIFYPVGVNLVGKIDGMLPSIFLCPVKNTFGPIVTINSYYLLNFLLAFCSMYFVINKITKNHAASFSAGLLFVFSNYFIVRSSIHIYLTGIWVFPLLIYLFFYTKGFLKKWLSIHFLLLVAIFLNIINFALLTPLYLVGVFYNYQITSKSKVKNLFKKIALSAIVNVLLFSPYIYVLISEYIASKPELGNTIVSEIMFANDLSSLFMFPKQALINQLFPALKELVGVVSTVNHTNYHEIVSGNIGFLELVTFIFLLWIYKKQMEVKEKYIAVLTAIYFILSFGWIFTILGQKVLPSLPYIFIKLIPSSYVLRTPVRYAIIAYSLLLIFIFSNKKIVRAIDSHKFLSISIVFMYIIIFRAVPPKKIVDLPNSVRAAGLLQNQDKGVVLNVPVSLNTERVYNFLQIYHRNPIVGGYASYAAITPEIKKFFQNEIPTSLYCKSNIEFNYDKIKPFIQKYDISYIFIHKNIIRESSCQKKFYYQINKFYEGDQYEIVYNTKNLTVFKIKQQSS